MSNIISFYRQVSLPDYSAVERAMGLRLTFISTQSALDIATTHDLCEPKRVSRAEWSMLSTAFSFAARYIIPLVENTGVLKDDVRPMFYILKTDFAKKEFMFAIGMSRNNEFGDIFEPMMIKANVCLKNGDYSVNNIMNLETVPDNAFANTLEQAMDNPYLIELRDATHRVLSDPNNLYCHAEHTARGVVAYNSDENELTGIYVENSYQFAIRVGYQITIAVQNLVEVSTYEKA